MYHNHEENIRKVRAIIKNIKSSKIGDYIFLDLDSLESIVLSELLQSMIEDAETGHKLNDKLEVNIRLMKEDNFNLHTENEELKKKLSARDDSEPLSKCQKMEAVNEWLSKRIDDLRGSVSILYSDRKKLNAIVKNEIEEIRELRKEFNLPYADWDIPDYPIGFSVRNKDKKEIQRLNDLILKVK